MNRYTKEDIQRAKDVTIQNFLGLQNFRRVKILCPVHNERTPSFTIYPDGKFHCFGCGAHGSSSIDFLILLGCTFPEAVRRLTE